MRSRILCSANPAACALAECGAFRTEGQYIAAWMRAQAAVKEESITDSYLYRLAQSVPTIRYKGFSHWEEARRTGADWEWWFLLPKRSLRLRVQAKKLHPGKNCRGDLARINKYGGQLAMLRKRARRDNAIPVYGKRTKGGYECELDVVGFHPRLRRLMHVEPSMDSYSRTKRESRYKKKFDAGRQYVPALFAVFKPLPEIEQIALFGYGGRGLRKTIGGGQVVLVKDWLEEIKADLRTKPIAKFAVPEQYICLRTIQFMLHQGGSR